MTRAPMIVALLSWKSEPESNRPLLGCNQVHAPLCDRTDPAEALAEADGESAEPRFADVRLQPHDPNKFS